MIQCERVCSSFLYEIHKFTKCWCRVQSRKIVYSVIILRFSMQWNGWFCFAKSSFHFHLKEFSQQDLLAAGILLDENEINHPHNLINGKDLLCSLVTKCEGLYGNKLTVYNVVGLLHLGEDPYFPKLTLNDFVIQRQKLFVSP